MSDDGHMKTAVRACPVCGGAQAEVIHTQAFVVPEEYRLPSSYDIVSCTTCGFVYADTTACQWDYDKYYTTQSRYEDESTASGGGSRPDDQRRLDDTAGYVLAHLAGANPSIVDLGCGNGGLLRSFRQLGLSDLFGVDPSPACAQYVRRQGIDATQGSVLALPPLAADSEGFDCVVLSHVLEHICDLHEAVEAALSWLKPDGVLYIETPDAAAYASRFVVPYYYFDVEHINHFDAHSLCNLAAAFGLRTLDVVNKDVPMCGTMYPCVGVVCVRATREAGDAGVGYDRTARDSVASYVDLSRAREEDSSATTAVRSADQVAVWGAGSYTQRLLSSGMLSEANIACIVDRDSKKQGTRVAGLVVQDPEALHDFEGVIVVCAALYSAEIVREIEAMGLTNDVIVAQGD